MDADQIEDETEMDDRFQVEITWPDFPWWPLGLRNYAEVLSCVLGALRGTHGAKMADFALGLAAHTLERGCAPSTEWVWPHEAMQSTRLIAGAGKSIRLSELARLEAEDHEKTGEWWARLEALQAVQLKTTRVGDDRGALQAPLCQIVAHYRKQGNDPVQVVWHPSICIPVEVKP